MGITHFSDITPLTGNTGVDREMTEITGQDVRNDLEQAVDDLEAVGGTCLSAGVLQGLDVSVAISQQTQLIFTSSTQLNLQVLSRSGRTDTSGGVMIFITDGDYACPQDEDEEFDLNNPDVLAAVEESGVRVITIAFSDNAADTLENLARISDGKAYFIPDGNVP